MNKNLVPVTERTKEEARQISIKGGIKSGIVRKRKKETKEIIQAILDAKPSKEMIEKFKKNFPNSNINDIEDLMNMAMIKRAMGGNVNAYLAIMDRKDGKPKETIDMDMTKRDYKLEIIKVDSKTK